MTIQEIRDLQMRRNQLSVEMIRMLDAAKDDKGKVRDLTAEERNKFDAMAADADSIKKIIDDNLRANGIKDELRGLDERVGVALDKPEPTKDDEKRNAAFVKYLRNGERGLDPEEAKLLMESRDFSTANANGGYTIPAEFLKRLEVALKFYGPMIGVGEIIRTDTGASLSLPSLNDTASVGEIQTEGNAVTTDSATPFGTLAIPAYMYDSKLVAVSMQLMQDSAFNIDETVANLIGARIGRILNTHFTTGDGSSKPRGIVIDATLGKTGTTGQTTSVIYDDLVDLVYAIDPAYRQAGNCAFMLNDSSVKVIRKLKDSQNRPLWEPSLQVGQPDRLMGFPVLINNDVAAMAASAKSILFGDFSKYKIRVVRDQSVLRLNERLADKLQVGFLGFGRFGGALLDPGTHPVAYYANSAT